MKSESIGAAIRDIEYSIECVNAKRDTLYTELRSLSRAMGEALLDEWHGIKIGESVGTGVITGATSMTFEDNAILVFINGSDAVWVTESDNGGLKQ